MSKPKLLALILTLPFLGGCSSPSSVFDCSGDGEARGKFSEGNSGALTFKDGIVLWGDAEQGYRVVLTDDTVFADAMRASPDPAREAPMAAQLLQILVIGYDFEPNGNYRQRFTEGTITSSGRSSLDSGRIQVDGEGCARGDVKLQYEGSGFFALPVKRAATTQDVEVGGSADMAQSAGTDDPLQRYAATHARLSNRHPVIPFEALGYSSAVATILGNDKRAQAALARLISQCPNPLRTSLNEYAEVVGTAEPSPGMVLSGKAYSSQQAGGAVLDNCYVMQRNGEHIDQCWPLTTDCTKTPLYKAD